MTQGLLDTGAAQRSPDERSDIRVLVLRGVTVNANGPAMAKRAVPN